MTGPAGAYGPVGVSGAAAGTGPAVVSGAAAWTGPGAGDPSLAEEIVALLTRQRRTIAVAESLTGGLLGATITAVPGASVVFRGGVVAYATDLKAALLGVPAELLAARGAVDPDVARAMAAGVQQRLGAEIGVATTGVAGPDPAEGKPPGTVHIAVRAGGSTVIKSLALSGSRENIRRQTVARCLRLMWSVIWEEGP
ncbi:MAG TPA: nicotinamide-nucleotide amidohydrolase family protein [Streptosporangiaceae bacterium]